jgi:Uma2 family endonuclease
MRTREVPAMLSLKGRAQKPIRLWNGKILPKRYMTEEEFVAWVDSDTRAEWVDGKVVVMSPSSVEQDDLNGWLLNLLRPLVEQRDLGRVLGPNVTARFASQRRRRIPDILFVSRARLNLVQKNHIEGAPDLIIEIVAPDSQTRDRREKYAEYEKAGVREYWILDPLSEQLEAYALKRGKYVEIELAEEILRSSVIPGFYLRSAWLWRKPLPKVITIQRELGLLE